MHRSPSRSPIRWSPALWIAALGAAALAAARYAWSAEFQLKNIVLLGLGVLTLLALLVWFLAFSGAPRGIRKTAGILVAVTLAVLGASFRLHGVTGDFILIFKPRWQHEATPPPQAAASDSQLDHSGRPDFAQYLGPNRNAVLDPAPALARDWAANPPQILWRRPIGVAWSGFAIVGNRAVTLEQRGEKETVVCLDVLSGTQLWEHADDAHLTTSIGGDGPRATPTIDHDRVFTFGGTGVTNCLDLKTGQLIWQRKMTDDAPKGRPEWGYAGSPLVLGDKVLISAGQSHERSLIAYRVSDGEIAWRNGSQPAEYSSPCLLTLAGVPQIVMFNMLNITSHDAVTGEVLWEYPWGIRQPVIAQPVPVGPDRVVFSSGYGVGTELLEIQRGADGKLTPQRIWKSLNLKAKLSSFIHRDGYLYGLDDGILTCLDLRDGSRKWKEGRYGHGQLLLLGDLLLVTAENGEILLLAPTPDGPHELTRFRVFHTKLWNPPALSGDLLLLRTDQEAACLRLPLAGK
jgi:outer membrane protein assembly factor BamB